MKKPLLILLAFVLAIPLIPFAIFGEMDGIKWIDGSTGWISFLYGIVLLTSDIVLPLPSSLIAVFLGAKLGLILGGLSIFIGLMTGSWIGYMMGRSVGRKLLDRMISQRGQELYARLENRMSYWAIAVCRSVPMLAEASVIAAGVAQLDIRKTLPMLMISNFGLAVLYSGFGYYGGQQSSPLLLFAGGILVPAGGMLILIIIFGKSLFRRPTPDRIC